MQKLFQRDWTYLILIIITWAVTEWLIYPVGEFPLNDDWSYTLTLENLYFDNEFELIGFTSMPLVTQLIWALLFVKIFGWSFTILRFSTIVLGLVSLVITYFLGRELTQKKPLAFALVLIVMLNPLFLNLANSFMTDVPFLCFLLLSMLFCVRAINHESYRYLAAAVIALTLATMVRQLAVLLAFSFAVTWFVKFKSKRAAFAALITLIIPAATYLLYGYWLKQQGMYPILYDEGVKRIKFNLLNPDFSPFVYLGKQAFHIFLSVGFFIFPILLLLRQKLLHREGKLFYYYGFGLLCVAGYFIAFGKLIPYMGNVMNLHGIGVIALRDISILKLQTLPELPVTLRVLLSLAAGLGLGLLAFYVARIIQKPALAMLQQDPIMILLLVFTITYLGITIVGAPFDRYQLPAVPVVGLLIIRTYQQFIELSRKRLVIFCLGTAVFGLFSISQTHNYFSWNRARWEALEFLTKEQGIDPRKIDGGFEFNGYKLYRTSQLKPHERSTIKSWWWVEDDQYVMSFGRIEGYNIFKEYAYPKFLSTSTGSIYILKRVMAADRSSGREE